MYVPTFSILFRNGSCVFIIVNRNNEIDWFVTDYANISVYQSPTLQVQSALFDNSIEQIDFGFCLYFTLAQTTGVILFCNDNFAYVDFRGGLRHKLANLFRVARHDQSPRTGLVDRFILIVARMTNFVRTMNGIVRDHKIDHGEVRRLRLERIS